MKQLLIAFVVICAILHHHANGVACPPGVPIVSCIQDPCNGRTCSAYPLAECRSNYCGGCNFDFFLRNGTNVTESCTIRETQCPMPTGFGTCDSLCRVGDASSCSDGQICCSNGCGSTCVMPVNITFCRDSSGLRRNVGETFMNDCNTCACHEDGTIRCTRIECNNVQMCPRLTEGGGLGACIAECTDDGDCTNGERCCGSCPRMCVEPVRVCNVSGTLYHVNQTFQAADGCNNCTCTSTGNVFCTARACIDPCQEEPDTEPGDCLLALPLRYYYDAVSGVCRNYTRGCDASSRNDFVNAEDCYARCKPSSVCNAPVYPGGTRPPCDLVQRRYTFFAYQGTCNPISYAVCGEDSADYNVFNTFQECHDTCIGPGVTPTPSNCSEGLVRCYLNPCSQQRCPNFPNATCKVDNCGGCSAQFFLNGRNVTDMCRNATPSCPDGSPIVRCAGDPCSSATCPAQPGARCEADYCGRCGFIFRNASGHDVTRLCSPSLPLPVREPVCPNVNSSLPGICAITCSSDSNCENGELCCRSSCGGRVCATPSNIPYYPLPRTCPVSTLTDSIRDCSAVRRCRNNTDCAYNQACCSSLECGKVCKAVSNSYPCSSVINAIRAVGVTPPPGYYTPQCDSASGRFNATQCTSTGYCWCVDVNTGRPVSSYYPRGTRPSCHSCRYGGMSYSVGETFPSTDGCNKCSCTANGGVICTLRACIDTCSLPPQPGRCRGSFPSYFYNRTSQQCERFIYGGCDGNSNRFQTVNDCLNRCDNTSRCLQRKDSGPCEALSYQFFFNRTSDRCEIFNYGGCQGNRNRFATGTECASACNPSAVVPSCATVRCAIPVCDSNSVLTHDNSQCCPYCRRTGCDSSSQFTCSNGTCIDRSRRCDLIKDCSDGGDERDCEEECEFMCGNGNCIRRSQVCDRVLDCRDGSDETSCNTRPFTGVVNLTPDLATECPERENTYCTRSHNCEANQECSNGTICCNSQCGGMTCMRGNSLGCVGIRHKQQQSGLLGAFVPVCQEDGSFNVTQCRERYCWCVDVRSGQPTSDAVLVPAMPRCTSYVGRNNQTLSVGETETSQDGCNTCVATTNGRVCSYRRCDNATCSFNDQQVNPGQTVTDECNTCRCTSGLLSCTRKKCMATTQAQMMRERFNVSLRMQGDYNRITDKEDFKRQVLRTLLGYSNNTGLNEDQVEDIKIKPGSVIVQVILVDSNSSTEGANTTILVAQMQQDFDSGVLIIRYDGQVLEPIPGGFSATSVDSDGDSDGSGVALQSWHIAVIVVGVVIVFVVAVALAVMITVCVMRRKGGDKTVMYMSAIDNDYDTKKN